MQPNGKTRVIRAIVFGHIKVTRGLWMTAGHLTVLVRSQMGWENSESCFEPFLFLSTFTFNVFWFNLHRLGGRILNKFLNLFLFLSCPRDSYSSRRGYYNI